MIPVAVLPSDLPYATLWWVPLPWLMSRTAVTAPRGRYRTAHELYELLFGDMTATSLTLASAEAAVREEIPNGR